MLFIFKEEIIKCPLFCSEKIKDLPVVVQCTPVEADGKYGCF